MAPLYGIFGFLILIATAQLFFMHKSSRNPSHGGIIKEANGRYYELLYFPKDGHLGLFLLDDESGGTSPIKRQQLTANVRFQNTSEYKEFLLEPHKQSSDPKNKASFFMACNKDLREQKHFEVLFRFDVDSKKEIIAFQVMGKAHSPDFRFKDHH